uniref:Reverse transcriptase domain-containing protein n=1 Tax=Tanacetum cinerariifolium TaxID=118510 RepID=A0A699HFZ4_TANCI|nr:hypothetical protein [Tanacetum cinerariifolium]
MKSIQTFLEEFNYIPFGEKPKILLEDWDKFFTIQRAQPENSNELFQKLLEDLKELAEYKESLENSSNEIVTSSSNQKKERPPQDSNIRQLIKEECCVEVSEEHKQKIEDTILELVKIYRQKELLSMHDNEVKNVVEQPAERGNRSIESLQKFRVIHKNFISLKNTSQISSIHAVAPMLSNKEPGYSPSTGYEHSNTTPKTKADEIIKSGVEELIPILIYDDFEDIEYVEASLSDPEIVSLEEENVVHQEKEEIDLEDISQIQDIDLREKLLSITRLIANIKSLNDNPTPDHVLNSSVSVPIFEKLDNSPSDNFPPEFETFCDHTEETRSANTTHANDSLPEYDSFCFEIKLDQKRLINVLKNDISDDSSNDPLLEEADLFLAFDNSIPPGVKNFADNSEGDIRFLEELLIDDSISFPVNESPDSDFNNPSIPRPPPEPPDF